MANSKYKVEDLSSIYGIVLNYNSFLENLGGVNLKNILKNSDLKSLETPTKFYGWDLTYGTFDVTQSSDIRKPTIISITNSSFSLKQNISKIIKPGSFYTLVVSTLVSGAPLKINFSGSASNNILTTDNTVFSSYTINPGPEFQKTFIQFKVSQNFSYSENTLSLNFACTGVGHKLQFNSISLCEGQVDLGVFPTNKLDEAVRWDNFKKRFVIDIPYSGVLKTSELATIYDIDTKLQGISYKEPCYLATNQQMSVNGWVRSVPVTADAINNFFYRPATSGIPIFDNTAFFSGAAANAIGKRLLVKNEAGTGTTPVTGSAYNGIYTFNVSGSNYTFERSADFNEYSELDPNTTVWVEAGSGQKDTGFMISNDSVTAVNTPFYFIQFSGAGQINASYGIVKNGNTLSVDPDPYNFNFASSADNTKLNLTTKGTSGTYGQVTTDIYGRVIAAQVATPVANGGTGKVTLNGILQGNGTAAVKSVTGSPNYIPVWKTDITSGDTLGQSNLQVTSTTLTIGSSVSNINTYGFGSILSERKNTPNNGVYFSNPGEYNLALTTPAGTAVLQPTLKFHRQKENDGLKMYYAGGETLKVETSIDNTFYMIHSGNLRQYSFDYFPYFETFEDQDIIETSYAIGLSPASGKPKFKVKNISNQTVQSFGSKCLEITSTSTPSGAMSMILNHFYPFNRKHAYRFKAKVRKTSGIQPVYFSFGFDGYEVNATSGTFIRQNPASTHLFWHGSLGTVVPSGDEYLEIVGYTSGVNQNVGYYSKGSLIDPGTLFLNTKYVKPAVYLSSQGPFVLEIESLQVEFADEITQSFNEVFRVSTNGQRIITIPNEKVYLADGKHLNVFRNGQRLVVNEDYKEILGSGSFRPIGGTSIELFSPTIFNTNSKEIFQFTQEGSFK